MKNRSDTVQMGLTELGCITKCVFRKTMLSKMSVQVNNMSISSFNSYEYTS